MILSSLASHSPQTPSPALQQAASLLDSEAAGILLAATSDISLIVGSDGVIQETATAALDFESEDIASWRGRAWVDTVTVESRPKIDALLRDAAAGTMTRWRQVNHPSRNGPDVPIRYAGLRPQKDGPIIVVGQDLRTLAGLQRRLADTQQALERDYDRLRSAETRYKLLFQLSGEPVLVADAGTRRVSEANPAAARLLGRPHKRILGQDVADLFEVTATRDIAALFAGLRTSGQAGDVVVRLTGAAARPASRRPCSAVRARPRSCCVSPPSPRPVRGSSRRTGALST